MNRMASQRYAGQLGHMAWDPKAHGKIPVEHNTLFHHVKTTPTLRLDAKIKDEFELLQPSDIGELRNATPTAIAQKLEDRTARTARCVWHGQDLNAESLGLTPFGPPTETRSPSAVKFRNGANQ